MAVFKRTGTTDALIKAVKPHIKGGTLLDLGCGSGVVGDALTEQVYKVYASDLDFEAIQQVSHDFPYIRTKHGSLFEPWSGYKFKYIVDDVSGVAESIAKVSPWFKDVPCASGEDGSDLICDVLTQAPNYLAPGGKLFFPIVSLSNVGKILDVAEERYDLTLLSHTQFPLPNNMCKYGSLLGNLKEHGIEYSEKFGMILFYTDIYMAVPK